MFELKCVKIYYFKIIPGFVNKCNICSTYNFMSCRIIMQHNYIKSPTSFKSLCWMNKCAGYNGIHYLYKKEGSGWSNVKVFCCAVFAMLLLYAKMLLLQQTSFLNFCKKWNFMLYLKLIIVVPIMCINKILLFNTAFIRRTTTTYKHNFKPFQRFM